MKFHKHGFFCLCEACRLRRRYSFFNIICIGFLMIIVTYQAFINIIIWSSANSVLLFIELCLLFYFICRIII
ncbi:MAG: hypothetical protein ACOXZW_04130 [Bacilli bacterium]|nr:hypothetical protein [Bacilli bacterium]